MRGGNGAGSMNETKASRPYLKASASASRFAAGSLGPAAAELWMMPAGQVSRSSRQRLLCVGKGVSGDRHHRGILLQFARNNFVQRVSGSVMIVKIKTAILHRTEGWHTGLFHRLDVSADVLGQIQSTGANFL